MLRIEDIEIQGIGPIENLKLTLNNGFNIICGANGIGKTTILDCIAQSFASYNFTLTKRAKSKQAFWKVNGCNESGRFERTIPVNRFLPTDPKEYPHNILETYSRKVIVFKTQRNLNYINVNSITKDPESTNSTYCDEVVTGSNQTSIKSWFVNRYYLYGRKDKMSNSKIRNYELATECFSLLDDSINFKEVDEDTFDIFLTTRNGDILFEYLSSGYKSCYLVLLGLIKEIEYRFKKPGVVVSEFDGIILIDELDLHLHPEFQAKIYIALKQILPKAQIIISTHSPHILQVAESAEIICLTTNEDETLSQRVIVNDEYGCKGWSVEEILSDVMGMKTTLSETYFEAIKGFNQAIANNDSASAILFFNRLEKMLHPNNYEIKVLRIQMAGLRDD